MKTRVKNIISLMLVLTIILSVASINPITALAANGDNLDLYAIKKTSTGTSSTEIHTLSGTNMATFKLELGTALAETGTDNSNVFKVGDYNRDGKPDLYNIKKTNTGSGKTEVHILDGANNFQAYLLHIATPLGMAGSDYSFRYLLGDYNGDGIEDIYSIAKTNTGSGMTEVHILDGATNFQTFLLNIATIVGPTGSDNTWDFVLGDYNSDGKQDIYVIQKVSPQGRTIVHVLNGATYFQSYLVNIETILGNTNNNNAWEFELGDYNKDGKPDIYCIQKLTGLGNTQVHILSGATNFQSWIGNFTTALGEAGSDGSYQFVLGSPAYHNIAGSVGLTDMKGSDTTLVAELGFELCVDATYQNQGIYFFGNDKLVNYCLPISNTVTGQIMGVIYNYTLPGEGTRWVYLDTEGRLSADQQAYLVNAFNSQAPTAVHQYSETKANNGEAYRLLSATVVRRGKGQIIIDDIYNKVVDNGVYYLATVSGPTSTIVADDCNGNQITIYTREAAYNGQVTSFGETTVCFTAGTKINTKDGLVNIEDVKVGDLVLSWDEITGTYDYKPVDKTFVNETNELVEVNIDGEVIKATPMHPFRGANGQWIAASKLTKGVELISPTGKNQKVKSVEFIKEKATVYNLEVRDYSTFVIGQNEVVVHNECVIRNWMEQNVNLTFTAPTGGYITVKPNFHDANGNLLLVPNWSVTKIGGAGGIGLGGVNFNVGDIVLKANLGASAGAEVIMEHGQTVSNDTFAKVEAGIEDLAGYGFELRRSVDANGNVSLTMGHNTVVFGHHADATYKVIWDEFGVLLTESIEEYWKIPFRDEIRWDADNGWSITIDKNIDVH